MPADPERGRRHRAFAVHLMTASGAVLALLALISAARSDWPAMFAWLLVALAVDAADGPLARRYDTARNAPRYDGVLLDLIVDYLTYAFIPAFAVMSSSLIPGPAGWIAAIAITFASALYFADRRMKTDDGSFMGFPGCWNMVVLVLFALTPLSWASLALILALAASMFLPLRFIHPLRTVRWRHVSLPVTAAWLALSAWAALHEFEIGPLTAYALSLTSLYLTLAGVAQQFWPRRP